MSKIKISKTIKTSAKYTPILQVKVFFTFFRCFCCWNDVIYSTKVFTECTRILLVAFLYYVSHFHHFIKTFHTKFIRLNLQIFWSFKIFRKHFKKQVIEEKNQNSKSDHHNLNLDMNKFGLDWVIDRFIATSSNWKLNFNTVTREKRFLCFEMQFFLFLGTVRLWIQVYIH